MECTNIKSAQKKDVTYFVHWMKSEMQKKAVLKSEVYNYDFISEVPRKQACKRLLWVPHDISSEDSSLYNTIPEMGILN